MRSLFRLAGLVTALSLFAGAPASGADKVKRIAVIPFQNVGGEKTLDIGAGIADTLTTDLGQIRTFSVVERSLLNDVLKEIKLSASGSVDKATAQKAGKLLAADAIVVGSYQKNEAILRITARVVEVESGIVREAAKVDGLYKDLFKLQDEVAALLAEKLKGSITEVERKQISASPAKNIDAFNVFSAGLVDLRKESLQDAIEKFDRALAIDPTYTEANFYKGMALSKLKRWDDAIAAFRRTLSRTQRESLVKWSWDAPVDATAQRTTVLGMDWNRITAPDIFSREGLVRVQKRLIYVDRHGSKVALHLLDLDRRSVKQVELTNNGTLGITPVSDGLTLMISGGVPAILTGKFGVDALSAEDASVLWHTDLTVPQGQVPMIGFADQTFWAYDGRLLVARSGTTLQPKWERSGLNLEFAQPKLAPTRSQGNILIAKSMSERKIHAIRLSDGQDAWVADLQTDKTYHIVSDQALIVFEPDRRVLAVDLETGKTLVELPVKQIARPQGGGLMSVTALVHEGTLYFSSDAGELLAVDLNRDTPAERRLQWKTPVKNKVQGVHVNGPHVYVGTESGEFLILDAKSGNLLNSRKVADRNLDVDYSDATVVVASSAETIFGLHPNTGASRWEYPSNARAKKPVYVKGAVILQTSATQLSALDVETGRLLWQYVGPLIPEPDILRFAGASLSSVYVTDESLFIVEQNGVKEYSLDRSENEGIRDQEALTELAGALLSKGDIAEASSFAERVAREADPNYPPLRYLQARLARARGNKAAARLNLSAYADLVGRQSLPGQEALAELKADYGLIWQTDLGATPVGGGRDGAQVIGGKLLSVTRNFGVDSQLVAMDLANGRVLWRQSAERFLDVAADPKSRRVFYARGQKSNPKVVQLYVVNLDNGERKELARFTGTMDAAIVTLAYANGRVFLTTFSTDIPTLKATVRVASYNAVSGNRLWEKTHESGGSLMDVLRSPVGLYAAHADFLAYSIGKDLWVVRGEDGAIYAEHHEDADIPEQWLRDDTAAADPNLLYFNSKSGDLVAFSLPEKKVGRRIAIDRGSTVCACNVEADGLVWGTDSLSIFALDLASQSGNSAPLKWRIAPGPNEASVGRVGRDGGYMWANRRLSNGDIVTDKIDPATGRIVNEYEYPFLWSMAGAGWDGDRDRLYGFTSDAAYSVQLKAVQR